MKKNTTAKPEEDLVGGWIFFTFLCFSGALTPLGIATLPLWIFGTIGIIIYSIVRTFK